jgi:hypothetical protein
VIVPPARSRYLAEIADTVRGYHKHTGKQVVLARERQQLHESARMLHEHLQANGRAPVLVRPQAESGRGRGIAIRLRENDICLN